MLSIKPSLCVTNVCTIKLGKTINYVESLMKYYKVNTVIVIGKNNPCGIITISDIKKRVYGEKLDPHLVTVEDVMSSPVIGVDLHTSLEQADDMLTQNNINRLPIIAQTNNGKILLGVYIKNSDQTSTYDNKTDLKKMLQSQLSLKIVD
jgi:CBS domain-containing protein